MHLRTYKFRDRKSSIQPKSSQFATQPFAVQAKPDSQTYSTNQNESETLEIQRKETQSSFDIATILLNTTPRTSSVIQPKLEIKRKSESNPPDNSEISENYGGRSINHRLLLARKSDSNSDLPIQAQLNIGPTNDKYEQEADRVASNVVQKINNPAFAQAAQKKSLQRQEEPEAEIQAKPIISKLQRSPVFPLQREAMPEEDELQTKSILQRQKAIGVGQASTELESSINSAKGSGQPLDAGLQQSMGQAMGADFSGVKVHTNSQSDQLNKSIQAKAFTTGQDVFFRQGAYQPGSRGGQELIAHELTHVVQQTDTKGGVHCKVQRVLDKNAPIVANEVQTVTNPHGNVYILTGHGGDSVVVKFEVAGGEGKAKYEARYQLGEELGQQILDGAIAKNQLTANDLQQLRLIPINPHDGSQALRTALNNNIDQLAVGIKMDTLALGGELFEMSRTNNAGQHTQHLALALDENKCFRYGQMAYYDVLTRNYDRFCEDGHIMNNLDFNAGYTEVVPLDNIFFQANLDNNDWQEQLNEMNIIRGNKQRLDYAATALTDIKNAAGLNKLSPTTFEERVISFKKGIDDAEQRASNVIRQWRGDLLPRRGQRGGVVMDERKKAQQILIARYEHASVSVKKLLSGALT